MSMIEPSIDKLAETKADGNLYILATATTKRSKELANKRAPKIPVSPTDKVVSIAIKEIDAGKVIIKKKK